MFSKTRIALLSLVFVLAACAGEGHDAEAPVEVNLKGGNCLPQLGERLSDFIHDRLSKNEVEAMWDCTSTAINDFKRITAGDLGPERYSPEIIRSFLKRYYFKDLEIDDAFLHQLMEVKRVLFSGTSKEVTREELARAAQFIGEVKAFSVEILPHIGVLMREKKGVDDALILDAGKALKNAIPRISRWLTAQNQTYQVSDLRELVNRFGDWIDDGGQDDTNFDKYFDLIVPVKQVLLGDGQPQIAGGEWNGLILALGDFYSLYLGVVNGMDKNLDALFISEALPAGVQSLISALERGVLAHSSKNIPNSEWYTLFTALEKTELLPEAFTADGLNGAWDWLLKRLLSQAIPADGLGLGQTGVFRARVAQWLELLDGAGHNLALPKDFMTMLNDSDPLVWDAEGRMVIGPKAPKTWDVYGLRHMIWSYVLIDWVKTAFVGAEPKSLTIPEFKTAVEEVLPVLQGFGWLADSESSIYVRLQREADLFTMSSNGNRLLEVSEAVRYLNFVVSGYRAADIWLEKAKAEGCVDGDPACVRPLALADSGKLLESMPLMKSNMTAKPFKIFNGYMKYAEEILFDEAKSDKIGVGDLLQVWCLFQYVDTFIQRYDVNLTDTIDATEGRTAFEVYGPVLSDLLKSVNLPEDAKLPFFTFMLKYGDTPFTMLGGPVAFQYWRHRESVWLFESERTQLMSILRQLAQLKN